MVAGGSAVVYACIALSPGLVVGGRRLASSPLPSWASRTWRRSCCCRSSTACGRSTATRCRARLLRAGRPRRRAGARRLRVGPRRTDEEGQRGARRASAARAASWSRTRCSRTTPTTRSRWCSRTSSRTTCTTTSGRACCAGAALVGGLLPRRAGLCRRGRAGLGPARRRTTSAGAAAAAARGGRLVVRDAAARRTRCRARRSGAPIASRSTLTAQSRRVRHGDEAPGAAESRRGSAVDASCAGCSTRIRRSASASRPPRPWADVAAPLSGAWHADAKE